MNSGRYDILFEPVKIGPVTAKNRFFQVPHCTGSGSMRPRILAGLREVKAEGGWAVVNTEYCSVHPSTDDPPHPSASLWDVRDIKAHALMTEKVHAHGALAGVELCLGGARMANLDTRETPLSVSSLPNLAGNPFQTRQMDLHDIREARRWHRNAALRAKTAGFDLVYVYATHGYLLSQFMSKTMNTRIDEYGGSLENRVRLLREIIEDTKDAVGDTMAVAVRISAETNGGNGGDGHPVPGETEDIFGILGELPDLWDININDYSLEMGLSRFVPEGSLEPYVASIKSMTSKPVVSVGRFTSPDSMVDQIKRGVLDFIGAARPSIADPFLPNKIKEGRIDDIRECIGCNICYMGDGKGVPIRCTQNPTISEEWRRGWHPEKIARKRTDSSVLVIGAGPTGLEAAHALGKRGYSVMLAEATRDLGGRVSLEARLPGLAQWARVRDYRLQQIEKLDTVEIYRESELTADQVVEIGADHIAVATGATWRRDGFGANALSGIAKLGPVAALFTPDDIMTGRLPEGPTIVYDDDHYYMGTVIAELLRSKGVDVTLMTPADVISSWGAYTTDRGRAQTRLMEMDVELKVAQSLVSFDGSRAVSACTYTGRESETEATAIVLVTTRLPNDALYHQLQSIQLKSADTTFKSIRKIGDCDAPAIIAAAVFSGHRYARELEEEIDPDNPLKHDRVFFEDA
ncbi:NADH:flavin oxidoreductase [Rhodobacteraceae bacterium R_SAG10]|jgi:dimethylamine/trimethylamine dehydrogenase|nr:NADH:flavin oxidoreductase [Rhodobacteraceae bacterium R_SAG10]